MQNMKFLKEVKIAHLSLISNLFFTDVLEDKEGFLIYSNINSYLSELDSQNKKLPQVKVVNNFLQAVLVLVGLDLKDWANAYQCSLGISCGYRALWKGQECLWVK